MPFRFFLNIEFWQTELSTTMTRLVSPFPCWLADWMVQDALGDLLGSVIFDR